MCESFGDLGDFRPAYSGRPTALAGYSGQQTHRNNVILGALEIRRQGASDVPVVFHPGSKLTPLQYFANFICK
jgi:hypothetical protein